MQLRHYYQVIVHWLWLIMLGTLLCAVVTYVINKGTSPMYEASALIQVNDVGSIGNSGVFNNQAAAVSYALQITNHDVLQKVAKDIPGVTVGELTTAVNASPLNNTPVIEVRADAHDAQQAANIANTVITVFIQQQIATETVVDQNTSAKLSNELVLVKANVDNAQAQLTKLENSQATQDQIAHQKDVLNAYQVNYDALDASYNQVQLHQSLLDNSLSIVQTAVVPTSVKGPHTLLNTELAAAMGLLLTLAFALILDWLDKTIKTPEDVAKLAMLNPLGSVPLRTDTKNNSFVGNSLVEDAAVEQAFVTISTSFKILRTEKRVLLVTSLHAGAGTSTTAASLALALTRSGMRVMLIDANLHHPKQHEIFKSHNTRGLTNSLVGGDTVFLQQGFKSTWFKQWSTSVPNLFLLPVGPPLKQRETIQLTSKLHMLVVWLLQPNATSSGETLADNIDIIIIDAPALAEGPDTIALTPITDSTLLVVEAGKERPDALQNAQTTLERLGSPIMGVVVNRQQTNHRTYFYVNGFQHVTVSTGNSPESYAPKYPVLRAQTISLKPLPETPLPVSIQQREDAEVNDVTKLDTVSVPTSVNTIRIPRKPYPAQTNGSRLSGYRDEHL